MTTTTTLPTACRVRAERVRDAASAAGITGQHTADLSVIAHRMRWDAYAASEFPRPVLSDAADVERVRPDLALDAWHHAAGAAIIGPNTTCCLTPAGHRDALAALAGVL